MDFKVNLDCFLSQKTLKVNIITHDLNDDLIFYCTHNQADSQCLGYLGYATLLLSKFQRRLVLVLH